MTRRCCDIETPPPITLDETHVRVGFHVALAGNPNCGKTTIFNALTGARQHVGNWPGKTIERKEGQIELHGYDFTLVDLPGTYSLSAFSAEEIVAMDYLLDARPDVVVIAVDAGNLERNLYLATQIIETKLPAVLALNMMDAAEARGLSIDTARLSAALGVPVVPMVARSGRGLEALKAQMFDAALNREEPCTCGCTPEKLVDYGREVEREIAALQDIARTHPVLRHRYDTRWLAIKLLESDPNILARVSALDGTEALLDAAQAGIRRIEAALGDDSDILITDRRYGFINGLVREVVKRPPLDRHTRSDRIDQVLTHPLLGLPVFAVMMWLVFQMTANVSSYYVDWIDGVIAGPLTRWTAALLGSVGLGGTWVESLVLDGVFGGVGGVLVFIPVLAFTYFFIALLEDSGYMARAAFLMDRFMHWLGLHGKSFIPMLLGFGCSVPGVYATRTLENERDRLLTGLLVPFMSCGARLPVYIVIGVALFGARAGTLVFAMYILGIVVAILVGLLLKHTLFRSDEEAPFVIELPPYRVPSLKSVLLHTWERTKGFVEHATSVILIASIIVWLLVSIPVTAAGEASFAQVDAENSALAAVSRWIAPAFEPAGFGNWQSASSLVTGFIAKEMIVSTLNITYTGEAEVEEDVATTFWQDLGEIGLTFVQATWDTIRATLSLLPGVDLFANEPVDPVEEAGGNATLVATLQSAFTPLSAVAFTVFVLLTAPCVTTMAALRHEFGTKWMAFSVGFMLTIAWLGAVLVYQGGRLLGLG
ncbi:MAG TPA: ferrous iron transport protein B [Aggregatilineales bacterium]|nr:ferrous iron transport protein B [Aggregatilineales bacterium]HPV07006.1 ferrous iron transport protein B [Aggregatilineales bacterium]